MTPLYEGDRSEGFGRFFVFGDENTPSNKFFQVKKRHGVTCSKSSEGPDQS